MTENIRIEVDGRSLSVEAGASLLSGCLANGIYIPHLCHLESVSPAFASCRLCFVEIEGRSGPVAACTVYVGGPMAVRTDTPAVRRLQKSGLRLLLSVHRIDCRRCPAHRSCELQRCARFLGIGLNAGRLERRLREPEVDSSHPSIDYYVNRCVLCGKCVHVCRQRHGEVLLAFVNRGFDTRVGYRPAPGQRPPSCAECMACIDVCPVAALLPSRTA